MERFETGKVKKWKLKVWIETSNSTGVHQVYCDMEVRV